MHCRRTAAAGPYSGWERGDWTPGGLIRTAAYPSPLSVAGQSAAVDSQPTVDWQASASRNGLLPKLPSTASGRPWLQNTFVLGLRFVKALREWLGDAWTLAAMLPAPLACEATADGTLATRSL